MAIAIIAIKAFKRDMNSLEIQHFQVISISNERVSIQKNLLILYCPFGFISFLSISLMFSIFIFCYKYNVPGLEWPLSLIFNWNWEREEKAIKINIWNYLDRHTHSPITIRRKTLSVNVFFLSLLLRRALLQRVFHINRGDFQCPFLQIHFDCSDFVQTMEYMCFSTNIYW